MNNARGFTLLELLIGLTLLGFILAILFAGFRLAASSWEAFEDRAELTADELSGEAAIRRLVGGIQPIHLQASGKRPLAFEGRESGLVAIAALTQQTGLRVFSLSILPDNPIDGRDGMRVALRHGPVRYGQEDFLNSVTEDSEVTVLDRLVGARFSYFGVASRNEPPAWFDTWPNPDQFPRLIRLTVERTGLPATEIDIASEIDGNRTSAIRVTAGPR